MGEAKSGQAFQNSQSGVELVMQAITKGGIDNVNEIAGKVIGSSVVCNPDGDISGPEGYAVRLFKEDGVTQLKCNESNPISDIVSIKSVGTGSGQQRAIEAAVVCAGADIDSGKVGWWEFDNSLDDTISANNATLAADSGANPSFGTVDGKSAIIFNEVVNKNYALISKRANYQNQTGTISFWVDFREIGTRGQVPFSKDVDGCINDCGHVGFFWDWGPGASDDNWSPSRTYANKMAVRIQNDNISSYRDSLMNDGTNGISINDNEWYLLTFTFDDERYSYYINGTLQDRFPNVNATDIDGSLEAMVGNDKNVYLGRAYNSWGYFSGAMRDLRIYERALDECDVMKLYQETK